MKKIFIILLVFLSFTMISCKKKGNDDNNNTNNNNNQQDVVYTVSFDGTTLNDIKIKEGETLSKPVDPTANNKIFGGWYSDANYTTEVKFPLVINSDTKIYAKFYTYSEAFSKAREKTIGVNVLGYEYDYTVTANASYKGVSLNGTTIGNTKYSSTSNVKFYDEKTNSGLLFNDGSKYQIRHDNVIQKITLNEKFEVKKFETEVVNDDFTYDTSSFSKALFEYEEDQLKSIEKQSNGEYKLKTSMSISKGVALVGNYLNHPMVEKIIGSLPETSVNTDIFVTFSNGEINTYRYIMNINVNDLTFNLEYKLTFKNIGINQDIKPKTFSGLAISTNEITEKKQIINSILNDYIEQDHSSYNFNVTTGVDFGTTSSEINSTFKGSTMRKVSSDVVYFHNEIEIDSDFKNSDLYKAAGIDDIHIKKTMLSNKEVHIIEKKVLLDKTYLQDNYERSIDDYYLFNIFNNVNTINYVQTVSNVDETIYHIGVNKNDVIEILNWLNNNLNLDPLNKSTSKVNVFGEFDSNSIDVEDFEFIITVKDNSLYSISVSSRGIINTKYTNSVDFNNYAFGEYDFSFEIFITDSGKNYEPFDDVSSAK